MSAEPMTAEFEAVKSVKIRPITENRVKGDGSAEARNRYMATAEAGTPFESVLDPAYWAHVAQGNYAKQPGDLITIGTDDEAWYAELLVRAVYPESLIVVPLPGYPMKLDDLSPTVFGDKYVIERKGNHLKFCVIRLSDGATVKDKCHTRTQAERWLNEQAAALLG